MPRPMWPTGAGNVSKNDAQPELCHPAEKRSPLPARALGRTERPPAELREILGRVHPLTATDAIISKNSKTDSSKADVRELRGKHHVQH
eukprot:13462277-Heterocapsa_arctica.AAC.1